MVDQAEKAVDTWLVEAISDKHGGKAQENKLLASRDNQENSTNRKGKPHKHGGLKAQKPVRYDPPCKCRRIDQSRVSTEQQRCLHFGKTKPADCVRHEEEDDRVEAVSLEQFDKKKDAQALSLPAHCLQDLSHCTGRYVTPAIRISGTKRATRQPPIRTFTGTCNRDAAPWMCAAIAVRAVFLSAASTAFNMFRCSLIVSSSRSSRV